MLFVVVSDTHGNLEALQKAIAFCETNYAIDYYIHLGDGVGDMLRCIKNCLINEQNTYLLKGNCDMFSSVVDEKVIEAEGLRLLLCHGHRYDVKSGLDKIVYKAKELEVDIVLHGHTHIPYNENIAGIQIINPGSLNERPVFILLEIANGKYYATEIRV